MSSDQMKPFEAADLTKKKSSLFNFEALSQHVEKQRFLLRHDPLLFTANALRDGTQLTAFAILPSNMQDSSYSIAEYVRMQVYTLPAKIQITFHDFKNGEFPWKKRVTAEMIAQNALSQGVCIPAPCDRVVPKPISTPAPSVT